MRRRIFPTVRVAGAAARTGLFPRVGTHVDDKERRTEGGGHSCQMALRVARHIRYVSSDIQAEFGWRASGVRKEHRGNAMAACGTPWAVVLACPGLTDLGASRATSRGLRLQVEPGIRGPSRRRANKKQYIYIYIHTYTYSVLCSVMCNGGESV